MTVLITGGMGALGSAVVRNLVGKGETPILYDKVEDYTLLNDIKNKIIFVEGDILDFLKLITTVKEYKIKAIIHTAALLSKADPKKTIEVNARGTENVLWAAVEGNVNKVVFTSSRAAYSEVKGIHLAPTYSPINEEYPITDPMGIYGVTKVYGELLGNQFNKLFGIDFISLRFSNMYGPGRLLKNPNSPMVLPCRIIENAMLGKPFYWPRGRDQKDDYIYYDDAAEGIVLAMTVKNPKHKVFNIGTGKAYGLEDFVNAAKKFYPNFMAEIGPGLDYVGAGFITYSIYDISRAKEELGYTPVCDIETGVARYIETMERLRIPPTFVP